jgi:hypothetical protein
MKHVVVHICMACRFLHIIRVLTSKATLWKKQPRFVLKQNQRCIAIVDVQTNTQQEQCLFIIPWAHVDLSTSTKFFCFRPSQQHAFLSPPTTLTVFSASEDAPMVSCLYCNETTLAAFIILMCALCACLDNHAKNTTSTSSRMPPSNMWSRLNRWWNFNADLDFFLR